MSFFKEFKDDLTQAVNELIPEGELTGTGFEDGYIDTLKEEEKEIEPSLPDLADEDDLLEETENAFALAGLKTEEETKLDTLDSNQFSNVDEDVLAQMLGEDKKEAEAEKAAVPPVPVKETSGRAKQETEESSSLEEAAENSVTIITKGTRINGSIISDGSLDVRGVVNGDVECSGKLSIVGSVTGNSKAAEIFINAPRMEGSLISDGSVKVGVGTIVIGDIKGTSGVIAGAVKGEVDVDGPVIIDSTAIVKGNINAKSVQINNGAVIDGYCSLKYSDVDIEDFFEEDK